MAYSSIPNVLQPPAQPDDQSRAKFIERLKTFHRSLSTNQLDQSGNETFESPLSPPPWGTKFAYYIVFVMALANVSIYIDVWVKNPNVILGVHVTRIIVLLSALILAIISFAKGWRGTLIYSSTDILVKLLSFGITLGYLISMAVRVSREKTASEIFRLVISVIFTLLSAVFAIMAIWKRLRGEQETMVAMYQIIVLCIINIFMSLISIAMRNSSKDESVEPPSAQSAQATQPTQPSPA